jgi:hypothetical protein
VSSYEGPMETMSDPEMVPLLNECAEFVRYHSTPEAEDTEEWHEFTTTKRSSTKTIQEITYHVES